MGVGGWWESGRVSKRVDGEGEWEGEERGRVGEGGEEHWWGWVVGE